MPKTPLNHSPLEIIRHDFTEISLRSNELEGEGDHGGGILEVHREYALADKEKNQWTLSLRVSIKRTDNEEHPPPYEGNLTIHGLFHVHRKYPGDPSRLIKITGASILYGAIREMLSNLTARSVNGMISLPSVSFMEAPEKIGKGQLANARQKKARTENQ